MIDDEHPPFWLHERVEELRAWATSRIAHCERLIEETATDCGHDATQDGDRAHSEKQTLEAVLRILDGKETP